VYDINDHAEPAELPRHQFGCEQISAGDATLVLTKDTAWRPQVTINQTGANTVEISVQQPALGPGVQLHGRLFPEHESGLADFILSPAGEGFAATVALPGPVPPLYLQLYAAESPAAPQTRREVIVDRGTGGGGAHGPAKLYGGVLVHSSDGNATYENDTPVELLPGQSIAWQSMPGTPPLPFHKWIYGQSYRLDAFPPSLVQGGQVLIKFDGGDLGFGAAVQAMGSGTGPSAPAAATPAIFFWNGAVWTELATSLATPAGATDGVQLAAAASQGEGVYAVLADAPPGSAEFLPLIWK
jgi:hypothetical protein